MPRRTERSGRPSAAEPRGERSAPPPEEIVELRIDALAAGGDGVGRAPTAAWCSSRFTAPGDRVRVAIRERRARWLRGEAVELVEPGPGARRSALRCVRRVRRLRLAAPRLPRCSVEAKRAIAEDALRASAASPCRSGFAFHASPAPYGYRAARASRWRRARRLPAPPHARDLRGVALPDPRAARRRAARALAAAPPARDGEWEIAAGADGSASRALPVRRPGAWVPSSTSRATACASRRACSSRPTPRCTRRWPSRSSRAAGARRARARALRRLRASSRSRSRARSSA